MQIAPRCRKCGKVMQSHRIDSYRVKLTCSCGFSDFRSNVDSRIKSVNPYYQQAGLTPSIESERGKMALSMQRANREHLEIISLEEISMLVSSDFDFPEVLQHIADKVAGQLKVSICTIYLREGDDLVMAATHGFDRSFVGKLRLKIGQGITGIAAKEMRHIALNKASQDPRYVSFPELSEERFNSMLSFPITDRQEVYGVINLNSTTMKQFAEDEIYFVSIISNLIMTAIKLRQRVAHEKR
ncbi:MAG TPA: GAF domain-containing protein [Geobacterales bacterium]|jgi:transcriptional regulator with GAF, ATPase, and Fis domain|nr:GAF domain-containing protein [Geobacterales bacterium]